MTRPHSVEGGGPSHWSWSTSKPSHPPRPTRRGRIRASASWYLARWILALTLALSNDSFSSKTSARGVRHALERSHVARRTLGGRVVLCAAATMPTFLAYGISICSLLAGAMVVHNIMKPNLVSSRCVAQFRADSIRRDRTECAR